MHAESHSLTMEEQMVLGPLQDAECRQAGMKMPRYRRVLALSKELDANSASLAIGQGILELHLPQAFHAQLRKTSIRVR